LDYGKIIFVDKQAALFSNDSVAQLDRALDYESRGRRFESCRGHHIGLNDGSEDLPQSFLFFTSSEEELLIIDN